MNVLGDRNVARWLKLDEAIRLQTSLDDVSGSVYLTLNHSTPAWRRSPFGFSGGNFLRDPDFARHTVLLFDVDPVRQHGIKEAPTTQAELEAGARAVLETLRWLRDAGVPDSAIGVMCSGNGFWVLVRAAVPNGSGLVRGLLSSWATALAHPSIVLDSGNYDLRRVGPFLGLLKRKGEDSEDRPYRRSYWICGDGSVVLTERDVAELLRRVGGEPAPAITRRTGQYIPGPTEAALERIGYERVFAALGTSPKHCLWCGFTAPDDSTTIAMLGQLQSCLRGTCRSMGRNARSLARVVSMQIAGDDDWRNRESAIRAWIADQFDIHVSEDECCF